jgi:AcrR family transcriptional regulator
VPPTPGKPLPRGRHGIPTDRIRGHQRERLIDAMARSCAGSGYASVSVTQLVRSAAVSKKTFYQLFESKEDCLFSAHQAYSEHLYDAIDQGFVREASHGPPGAAWRSMRLSPSSPGTWRVQIC